MSRVAITTGVLFDLVMLWILCEFISYLSTFANVTSLELVVLRGTGKIAVLNGAESLCEIPWNYRTIHVAFTARVTPWPLMIGWRVSIDVFKCLVNPLTGVLLDMQFPVAYTSSLHFMAMGVIRLLKTKNVFCTKMLWAHFVLAQVDLPLFLRLTTLILEESYYFPMTVNQAQRHGVGHEFIKMCNIPTIIQAIPQNM